MLFGLSLKKNYSNTGHLMLRLWLLGLCFLFLFLGSCKESGQKEGSMREKSEEEVFKKQREAMVVSQIESRGVRDTLVLKAMRKVPRHLFVFESLHR